jgi:hypothetical protein
MTAPSMPRALAALKVFAVLAVLTPALRAQTVVIPEGADWRFFRGRSAPPEDWAEPGFDADAAGWESGPSGFGYGDGDDATLLDDMQNGYAAVFLRIGFEVPATLEGFEWTLRFRFDDGFVAYLDGEELLRRNVEGEPPAFDALATDHEIASAAGFDEAAALGDLGVAPAPGLHVLAVEVHNATLGSSDLSFSAELSAAPFIVSAVEPVFGPLSGGNEATLRGRTFRADDPPAVTFGDALSPSVRVESPTELRAAVPAGTGPGAVDVIVEDRRGRVVLPDAYRYSSGNGGLRFGGSTFAGAAGLEIPDAGAFELWFRRDAEALLNPWRIVLAIAGDGGDIFRLETRGGDVRARSSNGQDLVNLQAAVALGDGEWHHLAFAFDAAGRRLYFDGRLAASDAMAMALPAGAQLRLGRSFSAGGILGPFGFTGELESARVWAMARGEDEIARDAFRLIEADDPAGPSLEAAWPFDEGGGASAGDVGPRGLRLILGASDAAEAEDAAWVAIEDFPRLAVTRLEPAAGSIAGGDVVEIYGVGFAGETPPELLFGGRPSDDVRVFDDWSLEAVAPAGERFGAVDVELRSRGESVVLAAAFAYEPEAAYSLVVEGEDWDYFVGVSAPPAGWNQADFDAEAAGWRRGPTGLGYGDDDDATPLPEMQNSAAALFARREFEFPAGGGGLGFLALRLRYDDGFVAYLNGFEVGRANVAGDPPAFDELASDQHEIGGGAGTFDVEIDLFSHRERLVRGRNALAFEVHNATLDSTDLSLSAELVFSSAGPAFLRGDADESGSLTISDAVLILLHDYSGHHVRCSEAADVDDDGRLTTTDAVVVLQYIFLRGRPPALPFPKAWPDVDEDAIGCEG